METAFCTVCPYLYELRLPLRTDLLFDLGSPKFAEHAFAAKEAAVNAAEELVLFNSFQVCLLLDRDPLKCRFGVEMFLEWPILGLASPKFGTPLSSRLSFEVPISFYWIWFRCPGNICTFR